MIYGSLSSKSINKLLATAVAKLAPESSKIEMVGLHSLPFYNQDMESDFPESAKSLKSKIRSADGIIIVTPEYNRSIPGVLKNMIDWTSRPYGDNAWDGRPVGVMGASVGPLGTAVAQYHLKQILTHLNAHIMGQPEFHLNVTDKFDAEGNLTDETIKGDIHRFLETFQEHIAKFT